METPPPEYQVADENKAPSVSEVVGLQNQITADGEAAAEVPRPGNAPSPSVISQAEYKDKRSAGAQGEARHVHWADHDIVASIDELNMRHAAMAPPISAMPPPAKTIGKRNRRVSNTPDPSLIVDAPRGRKRTKKAAENEKRKGSKDSGYGAGEDGVADTGPVHFVTERERSAHLWGKSHLPKKDAKMKEAVALVAEKEELEQKRLGTPLPESKPNCAITFVDRYTGFELCMLRRELRPELLEQIETHEAENGGSTPPVDFEVATPAAVWCYVCFTRWGSIKQTDLYGWEELVKAYPPLRNESFVSALLASLALAEDIEDKEFEKCVVDTLDSEVKRSLDSAPT